MRKYDHITVVNNLYSSTMNICRRWKIVARTQVRTVRTLYHYWAIIRAILSFYQQLFTLNLLPVTYR